MDRWVGKVAIITGASAGVGAAIAEHLVEAGLQVVGFARRAEKIEEMAKKLEGKKGKLHAVKVNVTKEEDILKGFKWVTDNLGPVSILVNNAGILQNTTLMDGKTDQWKKILDTNILGLCISTREAIKSMKTNKIDGHIVHINSIAGHRVLNFPNMNIYPATKHAVTALTETLRQEFIQEGLKIKITSVSPGAVDTEIFDVYQTGNAVEVVKKMPFLESENIADAVMYVLGTPPNVEVHDLIIKPVGETI